MIDCAFAHNILTAIKPSLTTIINQKNHSWCNDEPTVDAPYHIDLVPSSSIQA
jgi:hypothetical protein